MQQSLIHTNILALLQLMQQSNFHPVNINYKIPLLAKWLSSASELTKPWPL